MPMAAGNLWGWFRTAQTGFWADLHRLILRQAPRADNLYAKDAAIPADSALILPLTLPLCPPSLWHERITAELPRLIPFAPDDILWHWRHDRTKIQNDRLSFTILVIPRAGIADILAQHPRRLILANAPPIILPVPPRPWSTLDKIALILSFILLITGLCRPVFHAAQALTSAETNRTPATLASPVRAALQAKNSAANVTATLSSLSTTLPETAWLDHISLTPSTGWNLTGSATARFPAPAGFTLSDFSNIDAATGAMRFTLKKSVR